MAKVHIRLTTIKGQLQAKMHYDDPDKAFDILLYGWFKKRYKTHDAAVIKRLILKRGWMTEKQADNFTDYCITGWRIV